MNFKLYIFGESLGYKQYPDDSNNFKEYFKYQQSNSSLYIQRKADLVYYVYSQKIDKEKNSFLGFCVVFNGVYIRNFKNAFTIFEKIYSDCILSGKLFRLCENGKIDYATDDFASQTEEYDRLVSVFNDELEKKNRTLFAQLPRTYKMGQGSKVFSMSDSPVLIADGISVYDYISISNNNNNEDLDYVGRMLQQLYSENKKLKTEYKILNKQKKQYRWIAILSICVIASLIGLYFLNDNLSGIISDQSCTISNLESTIANKNSEITSLCDTLSRERHIIKQRNNEIMLLNTNLTIYKDSLKLSFKNNDELSDMLSASLERNDELSDKLSKQESKFYSFKNTFPINITNIEIGNTYYDRTPETDYGDTIHSSNTMYLTPRITYTGINTGRSINLKVKWYTPSGAISTGDSSPSGFSQQESLYVYSGSNTEKLRGWGNKTKGYWGKGTYRIEIWYENVCLKAKTFTIY